MNEKQKHNKTKKNSNPSQYYWVNILDHVLDTQAGNQSSSLV